MLIEQDAVVRQHEGLHARPAARLAQLAKSFACAIEIRKGEQVANAKSTVKLMLLSVKEGERIRIRAHGSDAALAIAELVALVSDSTVRDVPQSVPPSAVRLPDDVAAGIPASEGVVVGPAFVYLPSAADPPVRRIAAGEIDDEVERFRAALARVSAILDSAAREAGQRTEAQVFSALRELSQDLELIEPIERLIGGGQDAASSTMTAGRALAESFARIDDAYFRTRADDVRGIARQIAGLLQGTVENDLAALDKPSVLIAADLSAMDIARLPVRFLAGLVMTEGGTTSHVAIIARSLGIPAVVGLRTPQAELRRARRVAVNGSTGAVFLDPSATIVEEFERCRSEAEANRRETERFTHTEPRRDGVLIEVAANIGSPDEVEAALANGAMGVGLFRTEFLFMRGTLLPTEQEQFRTYARVIEAFAPRPVVIRTLDIGGDKPVPGIVAEAEANPFLGWRGIRMCLDSPELFEPQLRALLRAATRGRLRVMFPMVSDLSEVIAARECLQRCRDDLTLAGVETGPIEVGIMIETPAAALCAPELARHVDFFSIGTNDLTQYTMAADRTNARLAKLSRADHPAVLRMIEMACSAAQEAGIWVGVCGEAAGDPALIPKLLQWGVTELSMSASLIARAKRIIVETGPGVPLAGLEAEPRSTPPANQTPPPRR